MRNTNRHEFPRICTKGVLVLVAILWATVLPCARANPTTQQFIDSLRLSLAMDYGNPNAHLELAKALKEQGDPLTAFCICDYAKTLFGEEAFGDSFDVVFRGHISDVLFHAREEVLRQAIKLEPKSISIMKQIADLYSVHGEPRQAADELKRALEITPDDFALVKSMQNNLQAAGRGPDAEAMVSDWCSTHADTAPAWESRIRDQLSQADDSAAATVDQAISKFPSDGQLYLMRAQLEEQQKPDAAEADYLAAARLAPNAAVVQSAAGAFFLKVRHHPDLALKYYLAVYFLDPEFNDWESVDQRVREAAAAASGESNSPAESALSSPNFMTVTAAISNLSTNGKGQEAEALLRLTASDCPDVRDASTQCLSAHPDWCAGPRLAGMLKSADPWARAAAVSLWASTRHATAVHDLTPLLTDPALLVRYQTAIALLDQAPDGKPLVLQTMAHESSPWLRSVIAQAVSQRTR
jgi:tetratricopeptide (TPR) repeat protein